MISRQSFLFRAWFVLAVGLTLLLALPASLCLAHPAHLASANVKIRPDGRFEVFVRFDLLAFALNDTPARIDDASMNQLLDGPGDVLEGRLAEARERFLLDFCITSAQGDAAVDQASMKFPSAGAVRQWRDNPTVRRLPLMQETSFHGQLPISATAIEIFFPEVLGTVVLTVERPGEEPFSEPAAEGHGSTALPIRLASASQAPAATEPWRAHVAWKYLALGFEHIVPHGPDHVLFVLGLFLLSTRLRPLLWQVSAFTLAHSITLGLALYGVVSLPARIVEPLIALSIAFVAVENLFTSSLKPWRPFVVFGFGLVHGLGFAGVLSDVGLPRHHLMTALATFNIGVEVGQLAVIGMALAAVGWFRCSAWYRPAVGLPASGAIAAVAVFWTIERLWI